MAVDAPDVQMRQAGGVPVSLFGIVHRNAEFVGFQTGGDIRMGLRVYIGIDAQRNRRAAAETRGDAVDAVQFGQGFDVEAFDACLKRIFDFGFAFAYAGKNGFAGIPAGRQHTLKLAAGNDVKTAAERGEMAQDAEVAVGFDGVTQQGVAAESIGIGAVGIGEGLLAVNVEGRAELFGQPAQGEFFAIEGHALAFRLGGGFGGGQRQAGLQGAEFGFVAFARQVEIAFVAAGGKSKQQRSGKRQEFFHGVAVFYMARFGILNKNTLGFKHDDGK